MAILIIAAAAFIYYPTVKYGMVWDDEEMLLNEPLASGREHWSLAFSKPVDRLYRPLRTISYVFTRETTKVPEGHHAVNVFLFALTALSAYWFLFTLSGNRTFSSAAAMLYLLHPVHAEVVSWIIGGRANLLADPLIFSCLALYLIARRKESTSSATRFSLYTLSALAYVGALFSKESALIAPLLISVLELTFPADPDSGLPKRFPGMIFAAAPYLFIGVIFFLLRTHVLRGAAQVIQYHGGSLHATAASMLPVLADYVRIIFLPVKLCAIYTSPIHKSFLDTAPLISIVILAAILAIGFLAIRKSPLISFSIFWFFICILPAANLIPIAAMKANRFLGEAALSACIIYALVISAPFRSGKAPIASRAAGAAMFVFIAFLFTSNTEIFRNIWKDNLTLWSAVVKCAPESEIAFNNLGYACYSRGNIPDATKAFERGRDLNPGFVKIRENLGQLYASQGRYAEALEEFRAAYFYNPSSENVLKISLLYLKLGNEYQSARWLRWAIGRDEIPEDRKIILREKLKELTGRDN